MKAVGRRRLLEHVAFPYIGRFASLIASIALTRTAGLAARAVATVAVTVVEVGGRLFAGGIPEQSALATRRRGELVVSWEPLRRLAWLSLGAAVFGVSVAALAGSEVHGRWGLAVAFALGGLAVTRLALRTAIAASNSPSRLLRHDLWPQAAVAIAGPIVVLTGSDAIVLAIVAAGYALSCGAIRAAEVPAVGTAVPASGTLAVERRSAWLTSASTVLTNRIDQVLVVALLGATPGGAYAIAFGVSSLIWQVGVGAGHAVYSAFGEDSSVGTLAGAVVGLSAALAIPAWLVAEPLIVALFGTQAEPAASAARVLLLGAPLSALTAALIPVAVIGSRMHKLAPIFGVTLALQVVGLVVACQTADLAAVASVTAAASGIRGLAALAVVTE